MQDFELPEDFEWCRKGMYDVEVELACYPLTDDAELLEGFERKVFVIDGVEKEYAVKSGFNVLEQNSWTTSPEKPFVITGTVGERWPVKPSNMQAYDVDVSTIGTTPMTVSTKDPSEQDFLVAVIIPEGMTAKVIPSWAIAEDGTIDESQIMVANSESSLVPHNGGDYVVAKHIPGRPEYMQLPEEERDAAAAILYDPRIINGSIMQTTYDHAATKDEIIARYSDSSITM